MKTPNKTSNKIFLIPVRYLILLIAMFTLPIIYKIFTPLTIYPTATLLKIFYQVSIYEDIIIINSNTFFQIIPACIAGSAYLLLLILNLSIPLNPKKRIHSILFSFTALLILNILRIFILAIFYQNNTPLFDITHKLFWLVLSTIFVIAIWFLTIRIFSIKKIPVHSDIKTLTKNINKTH